MQDKIQMEEDMEIYTLLTFKENMTIFSLMAVFAIIWTTLMVILPLSIIFGYFALIISIVAASWMLPRNTDAGVEDNGKFVKVNL